MANAFESTRLARKQARAKINDATRVALRRQGNSAWDLLSKFQPVEQPQSLRQVVGTAIQKTRALLNTFEFPIPPDIQYQNIRSASLDNKKGYETVADGVILLTASFVTLS